MESFWSLQWILLSTSNALRITYTLTKYLPWETSLMSCVSNKWQSKMVGKSKSHMLFKFQGDIESWPNHNICFSNLHNNIILTPKSWDFLKIHPPPKKKETKSNSSYTWSQSTFTCHKWMHFSHDKQILLKNKLGHARSLVNIKYCMEEIKFILSISSIAWGDKVNHLLQVTKAFI